MNRPELIDRVANYTNLSKAEAAHAIEATFDAIARELALGGEMRLPGFGVFTVTERGARVGRNPATGATIMLDAQRNPKFKPAAALKEALNPVRLTGAKRRA